MLLNDKPTSTEQAATELARGQYQLFNRAIKILEVRLNKESYRRKAVNLGKKWKRERYYIQGKQQILA